MKRYILYRRVSTEDQGRSGLGLEAQQAELERYLRDHAAEPHEVAGSFVDIQSGKDDARPELEKAIELCKRHRGSELLVAKLDRLSRRVSYIARLMEEPGVSLRVASMPHAQPFEMHIYAALAEQERAMISERTKAGLAEAKRRGKRLGGNRGNLDAMNEARSAEARKFAERVAGIIEPILRSAGSYTSAARALNEAGIKTRRGGTWQAVQVQRIAKRLRLDVGKGPEAQPAD